MQCARLVKQALTVGTILLISPLSFQTDTAMELLIALCLGIGLSAACGFRVFIPPLALSVAALHGTVDLGADWQWLGTPLATTILAVATVVEVGAYYVPWLSNALDGVEVFAAPIAATFLTASTLSIAGDLDPVATWVVAAIAGGGTAEVVEGASALTRLFASSVSAGMGGPVVSFVEMVAATVLSLLAIALPLLAFAIAVFLLLYCGRRLWRLWQHKKKSPSP